MRGWGRLKRWSVEQLVGTQKKQEKVTAVESNDWNQPQPWTNATSASQHFLPAAASSSSCIYNLLLWFISPSRLGRTTSRYGRSLWSSERLRYEGHRLLALALFPLNLVISRSFYPLTSSYLVLSFYPLTSSYLFLSTP